jgi:hypothetical protein
MSGLAGTRRTLHGIAELVMAGPQHRASGTIRLCPRPGGFGTVAAPDLRIVGASLVAGSIRVPLTGTTIGALAAAAGVEAGAPDGVYRDLSGATVDDAVDLDAALVATLVDCYARGDAALRGLAPDETPVLWPEHFDLGITLDKVNYGVSLGDGYLDEPYAYVGRGSRGPAISGTRRSAPPGRCATCRTRTRCSLSSPTGGSV